LGYVDWFEPPIPLLSSDTEEIFAYGHIYFGTFEEKEKKKKRAIFSPAANNCRTLLCLSSS